MAAIKTTRCTTFVSPAWKTISVADEYIKLCNIAFEMLFLDILRWSFERVVYICFFFSLCLTQLILKSHKITKLMDPSTLRHQEFDVATIIECACFSFEQIKWVTLWFFIQCISIYIYALFFLLVVMLCNWIIVKESIVWV